MKPMHSWSSDAPSGKDPLMDHSSIASMSTKTGSSPLAKLLNWGHFSNQIDQGGEGRLAAHVHRVVPVDLDNPVTMVGSRRRRPEYPVGCGCAGGRALPCPAVPVEFHRLGKHGAIGLERQTRVCNKGAGDVEEHQRGHVHGVAFDGLDSSNAECIASSSSIVKRMLRIQGDSPSVQ